MASVGRTYSVYPITDYPRSRRKFGSVLAYTITPLDLFVVGLIAVLLFANRLPALMRSLDRSLTKSKEKVTTKKDDRDDPPTASGIFARIKPRPSGGTTAREPERHQEE